MKIREKDISFVTYMTLKTIVNKTSRLNLKELNRGIVFDITDGDSSAVLLSEREFRFTKNSYNKINPIRKYGVM